MDFEGGLGFVEVDEEEREAFARFLDEGEGGGAGEKDHFVGNLCGGDPTVGVTMWENNGGEGKGESTSFLQ